MRYCYMTGENPVSWLAKFVFINLYIYLKSGLNWPSCVHRMKTSSNLFLEVDIFDTFLISHSRELNSVMSMKLAWTAWNWHDLLFHLPTGKLKTLMNFNNSYVLFCLFICLCLNKQNVKKCFMIEFYIPHSENLYTFQNTTLKYFNKSC